MRSIDYNLEFAHTMLDQMDSYLRSKEVFWALGETPSGGGDPFPKLSLGALALAIDELKVQAEEMTPEQIQQHRQIVQDFQRARGERPANIEAKALAELDQRYNLWRAYVQDLQEAASAAHSYATDIRHRVLLTRLRPLIDDEEALNDLDAKLEPVDSKLRGMFRTGPFVWHPRLRHLYQAEQYWFLYGKPVPQPA